MSTATPAPDVHDATAALPADLQDERLIASQGVRGWFGVFVNRLKSGDLGSLPVVIGLIIIWGVFQALNDSFLSSRNLVNLTLQSAAVGTIAIGIVLVLLLGEIDLSVGSVSGLAAAILAVGMVNQGWPSIVAILAALVAGVVIGLAYGAPSRGSGCRASSSPWPACSAYSASSSTCSEPRAPSTSRSSPAS